MDFDFFPIKQLQLLILCSCSVIGDLGFVEMKGHCVTASEAGMKTGDQRLRFLIFSQWNSSSRL